MILLLLLQLFSTPVQAQEWHYEVGLGGEYLVTAYSLTSPHNAFGVGLDAARWYRLTADTGWVALRHQPSFGIKAGVGITPGAICGHRMGLTGLVRTPVLPWLDWEVGLGASFYSRSGAIVADTANVYISTLLTFMIDIGLSAHWDERHGIALRLLHSSNGFLHQPNRGLNYFLLSYWMALGHPQHVEWKDVKAKDGSREMGFASSVGVVRSRHSMQKGLYPCYDISFNYAYYPSPVVAHGLTVDLWYNGSHTWQLPRYHDDYAAPVYVGAMLFTEGFWGHLSLKFGVGYTLVASSRVLVPLYERVGAYYNFDHSYVGIAINAHGGQAEFVELTYGHRFKRR